VLPARANRDDGEVAAGALYVLEAAAAAVPVGSRAASLIGDALERQRAADLYFSKPRTAPGTSLARVILPSDKSDAAEEVRKNYRKALVAKVLADQNRRDLVHRDDLSRLRALERELAADARGDAIAAPVLDMAVGARVSRNGVLGRVVSGPLSNGWWEVRFDGEAESGGSYLRDLVVLDDGGAAAGALRRVVTRECVRAACTCVKTIDAPSTSRRRGICFYAGVREDLPVRRRPRAAVGARRRRGSRKGTAAGVPRAPQDAGPGLQCGGLCARRAVSLGRRPRDVRCLRDPN
jgi:hypothetical protein